MERSGILAEERRDLILDMLDQRGSVSVSELHRRLNVSRETIRRDITKLAEDNKLRKTHGGALSKDSSEPALAERLEVNRDGKQAIGAMAADMIPDGCSVIIDSGSTTLCLAESLVNHTELTVYTNDIQIASVLMGRNGHQIFLIGGELGSNDGATMGPDTVAMLDNYYTDYAFIGVSAMSSHPWITEYSRAASDIHRMMLSHSKNAILLADQTKFNRVAPVRLANADRASVVITDKAPDEAIQQTISNLKIDLRIA
ncbi:MAG: DeoR/GlpR transcriptional regulator [Rhodospirillales bacterium]|jgi:DeoR family transcriptional regulator, glycerol-3-phosphate regulon repressor|nr:DeoR/GlpR transcriptional regulator [Rhodospirillales bacterium]